MWKALIKLVEKWACGHKWKEFRETSIAGYNHKEGDLPERIDITMICKECGKIKKISV